MSKQQKERPVLDTDALNHGLFVFFTEVNASVEDVMDIAASLFLNGLQQLDEAQRAAFGAAMIQCCTGALPKKPKARRTKATVQ